MGMNPRLLRPILSGDPDALRYIAAVQAADQQSLEPAVRKAITDFVVGCKQDGIWTAIKACCILAGARTLSGALVPLKGAAPTNNGPFVSGDYDRETGLLGNGTSKYLNSNRASNADPQDSFHQSVYVTSANTVDTVRAYIGYGASGAGASHLATFNTNSALFSRCRNGVAVNAANNSGLSAGFIGASRSNSANYDRRLAGSTGIVTQASNGTDSLDNLVFNRNNTTGFSDGRLAFYSIGESLDLALLDTRVSDLYNAIGAAIP
jgi:hypothetical protein